MYDVAITKNYVEEFNKSKQSVDNFVSGLDNMVITDRETRDDAFEMCKQANTIVKDVDGQRKKFNRAIKSETDTLKTQYEIDLKPWKKLKSNIDDYSKQTLLIPVQNAISDKKQEIIAFDDKMRREEQARLAEIERKKKEAEKKHLEELKKAEPKRGVAYDISSNRATQNLETRQDELKKEKEDLTSKKSGREKVVLIYELQDVNLVPEEYLKPREVNWFKVRSSELDSIQGINITKEKRLLFK